MKLKTLSSNLFSKTVLKKDLTRFAPAMALYTVFMLLLFTTFLLQGDLYWIVSDVTASASIMAVFNFLYAPVCAQLLFGDLYNSRMCNALHAMPLRRESWFCTHILSGLLFSLLPNLLITLVSVLVMGQFFYVALLWLAASTLQYIFFFGVSAFCSLLVGNRFAMAVVYTLLNFFSMFVYWLVDTLIRPLLYGIEVDLSGFQWFSPVIQLADGVEYITASRVMDPVTQTYTDEILASPGEGWWYAIVCAVLGLIFLAGALFLYRRRKLESAGDFMAFKALNPVFLVIYSVAAGTFCQLFFSLFIGIDTNYPYLFIGLAVGYYTGRMLLRRTLRVFQPRSLVGLGALLGSMVIILTAAYFDISGVTRWVPEASEVKAVTLWPDGYKGYYNHIRLDQPEDIQQIIDFHAEIAADIRGYEDMFEDPDSQTAAVETASADSFYTETVEIIESSNAYTFTMEYILKDGTTVTRYYDVYTQTALGQALRGYFSRPACVFGERILDMPTLLEELTAIRTDWEEIVISVEDAPELLQAILLDCSSETMAQCWPYHVNEQGIIYLVFEFLNPETRIYEYSEFTVYESNANTIAWLEEHCDMEAIYKYIYDDKGLSEYDYAK